jgi:hypothetical protein
MTAPARSKSRPVLFDRDPRAEDRQFAADDRERTNANPPPYAADPPRENGDAHCAADDREMHLVNPPRHFADRPRLTEGSRRAADDGELEKDDRESYFSDPQSASLVRTRAARDRPRATFDAKLHFVGLQSATGDVESSTDDLKWRVVEPTSAAGDCQRSFCESPGEEWQPHRQKDEPRRRKSRAPQLTARFTSARIFASSTAERRTPHAPLGATITEQGHARALRSPSRRSRRRSADWPLG